MRTDVSGLPSIGLTALYTGHVWVRHKLAPAEFATMRGRCLYGVLSPLMAAKQALGEPVLADFLLARHRVIDHLLAGAIESGQVSQVVEFAAGMSPRGTTTLEKYGEPLRYVETDLRPMAERKRRLLDRIAAPAGGKHYVAEADVTQRCGFHSPAVVLGRLDHSQGVVVITEGLLNYLPRATVTAFWADIAHAARKFPHCLYLSDLHLGAENMEWSDRAFSKVLRATTGGHHGFPFHGAADAESALRLAGFDPVSLHRPASFGSVLPGMYKPGAQKVRIIAAHAS
ncbi:class I SAM-dependent methyltransferase [Streptomyces sp. NPDC002784]